MQIWKKLGLTVVLCVLSAGMTVNAGFTGSNVHSAGQSMGVGGLLEESMDPEACLEAAQNAKETRKKIYGYENLGVAKVNDYLNIRKARPRRRFLEAYPPAPRFQTDLYGYSNSH